MLFFGIILIKKRDDSISQKSSRCMSLSRLIAIYQIRKYSNPLTFFYSHSIVAGGFVEISYTTRLMPRTLLIISVETSAKKS